MHPLEDGVFAVQCPLNIPATNAERRRAIGLHLRADGFGTDTQQAFAGQVKQLAGVLVRVGKTIVANVEHNDRLGGVLDQGTVACLVLDQRFLRCPASGHVAEADDEETALTDLEVAGIDLGDKSLAVDAYRIHLTANDVRMRVIQVRHERLQVLGERFVLGAGQDSRDLRADELLFGEPEVSRTHLVAVPDDTFVADRHQCVGDAVKNDFDRGRGGE